MWYVPADNAGTHVQVLLLLTSKEPGAPIPRKVTVVSGTQSTQSVLHQQENGVRPPCQQSKADVY